MPNFYIPNGWRIHQTMNAVFQLHHPRMKNHHHVQLSVRHQCEEIWSKEHHSTYMPLPTLEGMLLVLHAPNQAQTCGLHRRVSGDSQNTVACTYSCGRWVSFGSEVSHAQHQWFPQNGVVLVSCPSQSLAWQARPLHHALPSRSHAPSSELLLRQLDLEARNVNKWARDSDQHFHW